MEGPTLPALTFTAFVAGLALASSSSGSRSVAGPPLACPPCLTITSASIRGSYRRSRFDGTLALRGQLEAGARLTLKLVFGIASARPNWQVGFDVPAGELDEEWRLPERLLPGAYVLEVAAQYADGSTESRFASLRIRAPATGVVVRAWASRSSGGLVHVPRIRGAPKEVWAQFRFASTGLPARGLRLRVIWYGPAGRIATSVRKPRAFDVASFVRSPNGLPKGRWRADLTVGGTVVEQVRFRVG